MDSLQSKVPHLASSVLSTESALIQKILTQQARIEAWFEQKWHATPPLLTASVDLRNACFKLAPVDTNVYPAGFNNLNPEFYAIAIEALKTYFKQYYPNAKTALLIPESHTRNPFYFENVAILNQLFSQAGFTLKIGSLLEITKPTEVTLQSGGSLTLNPIQRNQNKLLIENFTPDIIILNNDFSEGIPEILQNITQPIVPSAYFNWNQRSKTKHFEFYAEVAKEFANLIAIDVWEILPLFSNCGQIDFIEGKGFNCLTQKAKELIQTIQEKYHQRQIQQKPFIVIKSDAGTYGMAVMMLENPDDINNLNRKQRLKMAKRKGSKPVENVIIQEGVYTFETVEPNSQVAEPVVYMIGNTVIGGFYRVHTQKGPNENLNTPGMHFKPLSFAECCNTPDARLSPHSALNRFYAYGVIARLAHLATAHELQELI